MVFFKRTFPIIVAFATGITMFLTQYVPSKPAQSIYSGYLDWTIIIAGFAAIFGILSVVHYHMTRVRRRVKGYGYSIIALSGFTVMMVIGLFFGIAQETRTAGDWMFFNLMIPMQATVFATLAFFIASAAFRAFRARTAEATALLIAGLIVILGRVPLGHFIPKLTELAAWIMANPNMAAYRGITLGVALAGIAMSVRIIFGIERTYMGGGE